MTGGINKLKYHLAQIVGHEVGICEQATPKIVQIANKSLHDMNMKKDVRASVRTEIGRSRTGSESFTSVAPSSSTMPSSASTYCVPRTTPSAQPSIRSMVKVKEKVEADKLVGRCFLWSDIPFSIAKTNPFYQPMFDAAVVVGPVYKAHVFDDLRGHILQAENVVYSQILEEFKESWGLT